MCRRMRGLLLRAMRDLLLTCCFALHCGVGWMGDWRKGGFLVHTFLVFAVYSTLLLAVVHIFLR